MCASYRPRPFFWPLWPQDQVDLMHARLTQHERDDVAAAMARTNGSLHDEQLIYHAWNHPEKRYIEALTPDRIRAEDTRFNMLVRRYVDAKS